MHHEIKRLCAEKKYREAIDFVLRQKDVTFCKRDHLFLVGQLLLQELDTDNRNAFLALILGQLLQLGDTESEHLGPLVDALPNREPFIGFLERIGEAVANIVAIREDEFCFCE